MVTTGSLQCICQWEILYHLVIRGVRITTWLNSITICVVMELQLGIQGCHSVWIVHLLLTV